MLTDEVLDKVTERLIERINKGNEYIIKEIGKSIAEIKTVSPSKVHQLVATLKYGGSYEKIVKKLSEITNLNVTDIYKIFAEVAKNDYIFAKQFYKYRNVDYIPWEDNIALQQQVQAIANITAMEYANLSSTNVLGYAITDSSGELIFRTLKQAYYELIDEAVLNVAQGKETFNEAMYRQIKEIGESGLKVVYPTTYIGKDGKEHHYTRRLDSAIQMNMRGGLKQLHNETQQIFGKEFNADGVEISVHLNPAPDHENVQGHQFSNEEFEKFQNDEDATSYDGTFYPAIADETGNDRRAIGEYNCYHYIFSIVLGVTTPEYTKKQLEEIKQTNNNGFTFEGKHYTNYQGLQLQRRLETEIRKAKDNQIIAKASKNDKLINESQQRITQLTNKYRELNEASKLPDVLDRARVSGYKRIKIEKPIDKFKYKIETKEDLLNKWNEIYKNDNIQVKHILKSDPVLVDKQITQIDNLLNKYPFVKNAINNNDETKKLIIQTNTDDIMGGSNYARFFGDHYIELNEKYFKKGSNLINETKKNIDEDWWQPIDKSNYDKYAITHEFGHLLEYKMIETIEKNNNRGMFHAKFIDGDTLIKEELMKQVPNFYKDLSMYAGSKKNFEWFAEAFTQMELGKQTPITKALNKYIKEFMGGNNEYTR